MNEFTNHTEDTMGNAKQQEPSQLDRMIAWEQGDLGDDATITLFQELIDNGMAWTLQGCYGRMAMALIDAGYCQRRAA